MHHRILRMLAAAVVMALPLAASVAPARADDVNSLLGLVNNLRLSRGAAPMAADPALTAVAQNWSAHMASTGTLAHNPNLTAQAQPGWNRLAENVGDGGNLISIFNALVADPPHLANMIEPSYNLTGIAVVVDRNGILWITEDFAAFAGTVQAPTPPTTPVRPTPSPAAKPVPPATPAPRPRAIPPTSAAPSHPASPVAPETTAAALPSTTVAVAPIDPTAPPDPTVPTGSFPAPGTPGPAISSRSRRANALSSVTAAANRDRGRDRWEWAIGAAGVLGAAGGAAAVARFVLSAPGRS